MTWLAGRTLMDPKTREEEEEILARAERIADLAVKYGATDALIGGYVSLLPHLEAALDKRGIRPLYIV